MIHVNRLLDLGSIRAVGFDLDHTIALYEDQRVNQLADRETRQLLVSECGYSRQLLDHSYNNHRMIRGLSLDLSTGCIVKLDDKRRPTRAILGHEWLDPSELRARYSDEPVPLDRVHTLHTPFDVPTGVLFDDIVSLSGPTVDFARVCADVRTKLDQSHTVGGFKPNILKHMSEYVSSLPDLLPVLDRLRASGKRLFVLTNSDRTYALALLEYLLPDWKELFAAVVTDANKPHFFLSPSKGSGGRTSPIGAELLSGGNASDLQSTLSVKATEILFAGDSATSDIAAAARVGWRTMQMLPELSATETVWGSPFWEGDRRTWYADLILSGADLFAETLSPLLAIDSVGVLKPTSHPLSRT